MKNSWYVKLLSVSVLSASIFSFSFNVYASENSEIVSKIYNINTKQTENVAFVDEKVAFVSNWGDQPSSDGLTISYGNCGSSTAWKSNVGHSKGKYYCEMTMNLSGAEIGTYTNIGVTTSQFNTFGYEIENNYNNTAIIKPNNNFGVIPSEEIKDGDIVGIAMDLDNSKLYYSLNGVWKNGTPDNNSGIDIPHNMEYYIGAEIGADNTESVTANFGATAFKYDIPNGYSAYETKKQSYEKAGFISPNNKIQNLLENINIEDYEIHYLGTYEGNNSIVNVNVNSTEKPVLLVLTAYDAVQWNIICADNANIAGVVISGYNKQTYTGINNIPVKTICYEDGDSDYFYNFLDTEDLYLDLVEKIETLFGVKPVTLQGEYRASEVNIDGIKTKVFVKDGASIEKVGFESFWGEKSSDDGLTISYGTAGAFTPWKSNLGHDKGKYYCELTMNLPCSDTYSNVGITTSNFDGFNFQDEGKYFYTAIKKAFYNDGIIDSSQINEGDTIGIAMDLDNSKLFFSVNGVWINDEPGSGCGICIKSDRKYFVGAQIGADNLGSVIANFGSTAFKHKMPNGYTAYINQ